MTMKEIVKHCGKNPALLKLTRVYHKISRQGLEPGLVLV